MLLVLSPTMLAMYGLAVVGMLLLLAAGALAIRRTEPVKPWLTLALIGLAVAGVGGFGPSFLGDYGDFLTKLRGSADDGAVDVAAFDQLVEDVAKDDVPAEHAARAEEVLGDVAAPDAVAKIDRALEHATPAGRERLLRARRKLEVKGDAAAKAAAAELGAAATGNAPVEGGAAPPRKLTAEELGRLQPEVVRDLSTLPDAELARRLPAIDPKMLRARVPVREQ